MNKQGTGSTILPTEGERHLGRVVTTKGTGPVLDVGKVVARLLATAAPAGVLRATRTAEAVIAEVVGPAPAIPIGRRLATTDSTGTDRPACC